MPVFDEVIPGRTSYINTQKVFWQAESTKEDAGGLFYLITNPVFNIEGAIFLWESGKLKQTLKNLDTLEELYKRRPQAPEEKMDPFLQWIEEIQRQILVEQTEQDLTTEDAIVRDNDTTEDIPTNSNPEKREEEEDAEEEEQPTAPTPSGSE